MINRGYPRDHHQPKINSIIDTPFNRCETKGVQSLRRDSKHDPLIRPASYDFGGSLFLISAVKRSIGRGKKVVVLCSLEISRIVCRKRNCSAIGSLLIIAAACTIFSAA